MNAITTQRAERIAKNINNMDIHFSYIDDRGTYAFWRDLRNKLCSILETLSEADKNTIKALCKPQQAEFFNLV